MERERKPPGTTRADDQEAEILHSMQVSAVEAQRQWELAGKLFSLTKGDALPLDGKTYLIDAVLGQGGEGICYRAHDQKEPERSRVIKIHQERGSSSLEDKISREVTLANSALNLNMVPVRITPLHIAIIRDYIEGQTLDQHLRSKTTVGTQEETIQMVREIAEKFLVPLQEKNLVHKDIKPQNIICKPDGTYELTDFGLLRQAGAERTLTLTDSQRMSLGYARIWKTEHDVTDDFYALGETAYVMLTGSEPTPSFSEEADRENDRRKIQDLDIDPKLRRVLSRMLDCEKPYARAKDLIKDLDAIASSGSIPLDREMNQRLLDHKRQSVMPDSLKGRIQGIQQLFDAQYNGGRSERHPLDADFEERLENVLRDMGYVRYDFSEKERAEDMDQIKTVYVRNLKTSSEREVFVIKKNSTDYFDFFSTERDPSQMFKQENQVSKGVYNIIAVTGALGIAIGSGLYISTSVQGHPIANTLMGIVGGVVAVAVQLGAFLKMSEHSEVHDANYAYGIVAPSHFLGRAVFDSACAINRMMSKVRLGRHQYDNGCLTLALRPAPLFTYS